MKQKINQMLLAIMVSTIISLISTVSYAGNKPDTPVPKTEKFVSIVEISLYIPVTILTFEADPDTGDPAVIMAKENVQQSEAEATYTNFFMKRPERLLNAHYGWLERSLLKVHQNRIRPPSLE